MADPKKLSERMEAGVGLTAVAQWLPEVAALEARAERMEEALRSLDAYEDFSTPLEVCVRCGDHCGYKNVAGINEARAAARAALSPPEPDPRADGDAKVSGQCACGHTESVHMGASLVCNLCGCESYNLAPEKPGPPPGLRHPLKVGDQVFIAGGHVGTVKRIDDGRYFYVEAPMVSHMHPFLASELQFIDPAADAPAEPMPRAKARCGAKHPDGGGDTCHYEAGHGDVWGGNHESDGFRVWPVKKPASPAPAAEPGPLDFALEVLANPSALYRDDTLRGFIRTATLRGFIRTAAAERDALVKERADLRAQLAALSEAADEHYCGQRRSVKQAAGEIGVDAHDCAEMEEEVQRLRAQLAAVQRPLPSQMDAARAAVIRLRTKLGERFPLTEWHAADRAYFLSAADECLRAIPAQYEDNIQAVERKGDAS